MQSARFKLSYSPMAFIISRTEGSSRIGVTLPEEDMGGCALYAAKRRKLIRDVTLNHVRSNGPLHISANREKSPDLIFDPRPVLFEILLKFRSDLPGPDSRPHDDVVELAQVGVLADIDCVGYSTHSLRYPDRGIPRRTAPGCVQHGPFLAGGVRVILERPRVAAGAAAPSVVSPISKKALRFTYDLHLICLIRSRLRARVTWSA